MAALNKTVVGAPSTQQMFHENPRQLVTELVLQNPGKSKEELFAKFRKLVRTEGCRQAIEWYFFVNMYEYMCGTRNVKKRPLDAEVKQLKERIVAIVLLDLVLPNGKRLRDATFSDCAQAGGWYAKVAAMGKPNQIVGDVLTEQQLKRVRLAS